MATMGDTVLAIIQNIVHIFLRIPMWFFKLRGDVRTHIVLVGGGVVFVLFLLLWFKWVYL